MNLSNHFLNPHRNLKSTASRGKELYILSTLCEERHLFLFVLNLLLPSSVEGTFWIGKENSLLSPLYPTDDH